MLFALLTILKKFVEKGGGDGGGGRIKKGLQLKDFACKMQ